MSIHLSSLSDFRARIQGNHLTVVDFSASWCGPCKKIAPVFEQLARNHPNVVFLKIDVDEAEEIATDQDVQSMPTFKFFRNNALLHQFEGADQNALTQTVDRLSKTA